MIRNKKRGFLTLISYLSNNSLDLLVRNNFWGDNDLSQIQNQSKEAQNITSSHHDLMKRILEEIDQSIRGKRKIMYSDIINLIIREDYRGKMYDEILLWCNYNIRRGKYIVMNEKIKF